MKPMRAGVRAYSLIELLVCVVIIAILTTISMVYYAGALDQSDLKYAAPAVVGRLEELRRESAETNAVIRVEFQLGTSQFRVSRRMGTETTDKTEDMAAQRLIKRSLKFRKYQWPDGSETPTEFTFYPTTKPSGGKVTFGSALAETSLIVQNDRVQCEWGIRNPQ